MDKLKKMSVFKVLILYTNKLLDRDHYILYFELEARIKRYRIAFYDALFMVCDATSILRRKLRK